MRETPHNSSKPSIRPSWLILGLIIILSIAGYFVLRAKHEVPASGASDGTEIFGDRKIVENSSIISFPEVVRRAKAGDPKWQVAVGNAYFDGVFQAKDDAEAVKWITLASDAGHIPAHARLGFLYDNMKGSLRDRSLAFKYYLKSAIHGERESQYIVGNRLLKGDGVAIDGLAAYAWFNVCAASFHRDAGVMRDLISLELSPAQIVEAQKLSRQFIGDIEANLDKK
jgi:TPR repeat protein